MSDIGDGVVGGHTNQEMQVIASAIDAESNASDLTNDTRSRRADPFRFPKTTAPTHGTFCNLGK
jgi:hypothetical protein